MWTDVRTPVGAGLRNPRNPRQVMAVAVAVAVGDQGRM